MFLLPAYIESNICKCGVHGGSGKTDGAVWITEGSGHGGSRTDRDRPE